MLQIQDLVFQSLVNRTKLFALLLTIFGCSLLVMLEMVTDIPVFLLEFRDGFFQIGGPGNSLVPLHLCLGQVDACIFQSLSFLVYFVGKLPDLDF